MFDRPRATNATTSRSWSVSTSSGVGSRGGFTDRWATVAAVVGFAMLAVYLTAGSQLCDQPELNPRMGGYRMLQK